MLDTVRRVVAETIDRTAERVASDVIIERLTSLAEKLDGLCERVRTIHHYVDTRIGGVEQKAKQSDDALKALAARVELLEKRETCAIAERRSWEESAQYEMLCDFLRKRYPERYAEARKKVPFFENCDIALLVISLLTPGDGSEEAWKQSRILEQEGPKKRSVVQPELGQCRSNEDGDVIRIDAELPNGTFIPIGIMGKAPSTPGWPMKPEAIVQEWPFVLAGKVYADPGPRVGFGG